MLQAEPVTSVAEVYRRMGVTEQSFYRWKKKFGGMLPNDMKKMKVAMFGSNMRQVAVNDCDRVESEIRYDCEVNYYAVGDLVKLVRGVTEEQLDAKLKEY